VGLVVRSFRHIRRMAPVSAAGGHRPARFEQSRVVAHLGDGAVSPGPYPQ
jgi:hypothetical protein